MKYWNRHFRANKYTMRTRSWISLQCTTFLTESIGMGLYIHVLLKSTKVRMNHLSKIWLHLINVVSIVIAQHATWHVSTRVCYLGGGWRRWPAWSLPPCLGTRWETVRLWPLKMKFELNSWISFKEENNNDNWHTRDSYPVRASPPSPRAAWSPAPPSRRSARTGWSGWRSSRGSSSGSWFGKWCQGRARDSSHTPECFW